jgi:hypothetical protein
MKLLKRYGFGTAILAAALFLACDNKKSPTANVKTDGPAVDAEANAVAVLEDQKEQNAAHCRVVLQQLDNLESVKTRPVASEAERKELASFLNLNPTEVAELTQSNFSQTDAAYLEECLLVRAGARSLRLDSRPPLEQARRSFEWVCRMVYVDDRVPWPANPWTTLHAGSGIPLSRAYVVLAVWQQLGLEGCLIGPPALKDSKSIDGDPTRPEAAPTSAPVRACGVKIGKEVYLFDAATGRAIPSTDGNGVLTLAQARAKPDAIRGLKSSEAKDWQVHLAHPLAAMTRRMEWLQRLNPGNLGARLFVDLAQIRSRFASDIPGIQCVGWNPENDGFTPTRVLIVYNGEQSFGRESAAYFRETHRVKMIPLEHLPQTKLEGRSLNHLKLSFIRPFATLRFSPDAPSELILRGQFQDATATLAITKEMADLARTRFERDKGLSKDFEKWAEHFQGLNAQHILAEQNNPAAAPAAARAVEQFRMEPRNADIERSFILGHASKPLLAEVSYQTALCIHERAERAQLDNSTQAKANWKNAEEWWSRFLDASAEARSPLAAREAHARGLLERCRQFTSK